MTSMPNPPSARLPLVLLLLLLAAALAACSSPRGPKPGAGARSGADAQAAGARSSAGTPSAAVPGTARGGYYLDDGPGENAPDPTTIADAMPRYEPLLPRTQRPYSVFGQQYTPMTRLEPFRERGMASWYGRRYHGRPTSSGEPYDMYAMTAAHPTLPIPSYARVTHRGSGRSVVVRVNDRGPFLQQRVIDLSYTAAAKLGFVQHGSAEVDVELITDFSNATTLAAAPAAAGVGAAVAPPPAAASVSTPASTSTLASAAAPAAGAMASTTPGATTAAPLTLVSSSTAGDAASGRSPAEPVRLSIETEHGAPPRVEPRLESSVTMSLPASVPPGSVSSMSTASASATSQQITAAPSAPLQPSMTLSPSAPQQQSTASLPSAPPQQTSTMPANLPPQQTASTPPPKTSNAAPRSTSVAAAAADPGFWVQFGAFGSMDAAHNARQQLSQQLDWLASRFDIRREGALYKLQVGPWQRREHAQSVLERVRKATPLRPFLTAR